MPPTTDFPSRPTPPAFEYWDFPNEAPVRETPPASVSAIDRSNFQELLEAGANAPTTCGEQMFVFLGLDFGTSSTKMVVRLPFEAGEPAIAIPAPAPCRINNEPYLWQTVLWLVEEGAFSPWPVPGSTVLHSLKQGLIQGRSVMPIFNAEHPAAVTRSQAGVAYLAFVIRYVKGWLQHNRPDLFRERDPIWLLNLGMPTASYDDLKIAKPYRHIGRAALLLAGTNTRSPSTRRGSPSTIPMLQRREYRRRLKTRWPLPCCPKRPPK